MGLELGMMQGLNLLSCHSLPDQHEAHMKLSVMLPENWSLLSIL